MNADQATNALRAAQSLSAADREHIVAAYALPPASPNSAVWDELIARAASDDAPITVVEIARLRDGSQLQGDAYLAAIVAATEQVGGTPLAVVDILEPGVGDLLSEMAYAGGVATDTNRPRDYYPGPSSWWGGQLAITPPSPCRRRPRS